VAGSASDKVLQSGWTVRAPRSSVDYVDSAGGVRQTVRDLEQSAGPRGRAGRHHSRGRRAPPDVCAPVDEAWTRFGSADILVSNAASPAGIVNISSVHEDTAFPVSPLYCASEGGLRMPMRDLTVELGPLASPRKPSPRHYRRAINKALLAGKPRLDAPLDKIPLGRLGKPEDLASVVTFLAAAPPHASPAPPLSSMADSCATTANREGIMPHALKITHSSATARPPRSSIANGSIDCSAGRLLLQCLPRSAAGQRGQRLLEDSSVALPVDHHAPLPRTYADP